MMVGFGVSLELSVRLGNEVKMDGGLQGGKGGSGSMYLDERGESERRGKHRRD